MPEKIGQLIQPVYPVEKRIIDSTLTNTKDSQEQSKQKPDNGFKREEPQKKPLKKGSTFERTI